MGDIDTPPRLRPHGCSLHRRRQPHSSTKDLPGPYTVARRSVLSVGAVAARSADPCVRTDRLVGTPSPQAEHSCAVSCGATTLTCFPAHAAWYSSGLGNCPRNRLPPASLLLV